MTDHASDLPGPSDRSPDELKELSRQLLVDFMPMASFAEDPFVLVEGDGVRVRDSNGRWYIDGMSGVFVSSFGHGNRRLIQAAADQAGRLAFGAPLYSANLPSLELMDRLLEVTAGGYAVGKLTASGSEATEAAIKMARQYQHQSGQGRRFKILSHYRSYHGSTGHALAASGGAGWRSAFEPYAAGFVHVHAPFAIARRLGDAVGAADGQAAEDAALALVEETIELEDPATIAGFITEPIMLSAGVRIPPSGYLRRLHELLRRHDILLIFDEIITGLGRTGRLFASEWFDVVPDILCFGKGISGGYAPLAGLLVQPHVGESFWSDATQGREFRDGHTYGNNPLAAAVGLAALQQLRDDGLVEQSARQGERLAGRLRAGDAPGVLDVRGRGLLVGVEFDGPTGPAVSRAARERGLIVRQGPDFVALGPPLIVTDTEIDEIADITLASIAAVQSSRASCEGRSTTRRVATNDVGRRLRPADPSPVPRHDDVRTMPVSSPVPIAPDATVPMAPLDRGLPDGLHYADSAVSLTTNEPRFGTAELPAHLRSATDQAAQLLGASGAMLYLLDESGSVLRWGYDAGIRDADELAWIRSLQFPVGVGLFGRAVSEGRPQSTAHYRLDPGFVHSPLLDRFVREMDVQSMVVAPLVGAAGPIGALGAFSREPDAFNDQSLALIAALAGHAALAVENARLIDELDMSREALSARAESERALREIAARITAIRDPAAIARDVVEESHHLLHTDFALLALVTDDEIHSAVVAGDLSPDAVRIVTGPGLHVRGSLLGRAVNARSAVTTADYLADVVEREPGHNVELARLLEIRGIAVAPLRVEQRVVGLLGVWGRKPRVFDASELVLLQGMADIAAIAVENARLTTELGTSEERYRFLIERAPDMVWQVDHDERLIFINDRVESLLGWQPRELVGKSAFELIHDDSIDDIRRRWASSWSEPGIERMYRFHARHRDGHAVPVELRSVGIMVDGELQGFQGSLRDETERERLEGELRESEQRYRFLTEHSPDIIVAVDAAGIITFVSGRALQLTGWTPDEVVGRPFVDLVHPDGRAAMRTGWATRHEQPEAELQYRLVLLHRNGQPIPVEVRSVGIVVDGEWRGVQASVRDMSERDRMERELRRQEAEIAASQERAKLAQELHDSVTQALFSMTLTTRSAEMLLERDPSRVAEKLIELRGLASDALAEMRGLIFELRPGSLDKDGLSMALRKHAAAVQGRTGMPVAVEAAETAQVGPAAEEALYRIAQEALHNVVKHARATEARIVLASGEDGVRLTIIDNGAGFDPDGVPSGHLGLEGMRARAERIGGSLRVHSRPGAGSRIEVTAPLAALLREPAGSDVAAAGGSSAQ